MGNPSKMAQVEASGLRKPPVDSSLREMSES
jgi:hypothetical protein